MQAKTNKMDCTFVRSNLFSYQEQQLSAKDRIEFEDHLLSCEECSRIVSEFQSVTSLFDKKKSIETNPFIRTRILQRIENQMTEAGTETNPFIQKILRPISISFVLLIAIVIGFSIGKQKETRFSDANNHQNDLQAMKTELNIPDFMDEDKTFFDIH
jgi:hypothetical protein